MKKCKVIHHGKDNAFSYELGECCLIVSESERDLGVIIDSDLKGSKQCAKAAATANCVQGMISSTISSKSRDIIVNVY